MPKPKSAIPKTAGKPGLEKLRPLVSRGLPPTPGIANLIVIKSGEELHAAFEERLEAMKKDFEKVQFFWTHLIGDPNFHDSKEFKEYGDVVRGWELQAGLKDLVDYKNKMKRLKVLIDHFKPGFDYELTVQEVVEALS